MMKKIVLSLLLPFICVFVFAQNTNISGSINKYSKVTSTEYCGNRITVDTPSLFQVGMQVLIIQMQGVTIDQTNTTNYGNITDYGHAGNYEIETIDSILGDTIKFRYQLERKYDVNHSVQLIPIPAYHQATVNGVLTCKGWDGNTGGVLVLKADTLILNDSIDITGKGFRGFYDNDSSQLCFGNLTDYFYTDSMHGSIKGEGVVQYPYFFGRGKNANGGGGGDNENTGGGGGGNFGIGGAGGSIVARSAFCLGNGPGDGGTSLAYSDSLNRIFMGGGGGCGHGNNSEGTPGTNGGGICIIIAKTLIGNNQYILANGFDQNRIAGSDGAGGGGAGGTVILNVNQYIGHMSVIAHGGLGGSLDNDQIVRSCMGPAGGGGGGVLWVNQATVPANITFSAQGGPNGINLDLVSSLCAYGVSNGAMPGDTGGSVTGLLIPIDTIPYIRLTSTSSGDTTVCNDQRVLLNAMGLASDSVYYIWSTGQTTSSISFLATQSGPYTVTVSDQNTCTFVKQINVKVYVVSPNFTPSTFLCSPQNITLSAQNPSGTAVTYAWSNGATTPTTTFFADSSTIYSVTVTSDSLPSCKAIDTIYVGVGNLIVSYSPSLDTSVCPGNPVILSANTNFSAGITYTWNTNAQTPSITVFPISDTTFDVTVSAGPGCTSTHSFVITRNYLGTFITADTTICPGGTASATVTVPNVNNLSYLWSNGDTTQHITVAPEATTIYTVTPTDTSGCTGNAAVTVYVDPIRTPIHDTTICPGSNAVLSAPSGTVGHTTYLWSNGSTTPMITISPQGTSMYTVTIKDSLTCTATDTIIVLINNNATHLNPQITAIPDSSAAAGDSVQLSVTGQRLISFSWAPAEYLTNSNIQSPVATPLVATYYCVAVIDSSLCTDTVCKEIIVGTPTALIAIPNAFSPNGDGKNDLYVVLAQSGTIITSVKIYDRRGTLLFDDTTGRGWDGRFLGAPQPTAAYVCFVTYYQQLYPDVIYHKVGAFDLLR